MTLIWWWWGAFLSTRATVNLFRSDVLCEVTEFLYEHQIGIVKLYIPCILM